MRKLFDGIVEFKKNDFESHKELFQNLGRKHAPHTLFIGCSDSRIDPALITKTLPGELFIIRNIANIVPLYHKTNEYLSTTSTIEYAINVLDVKNIVVCGHSNCGGCAALFWKDEQFKNIPHTKKWLKLARKVKDQALKQIPEEDEPAREWLVEQMNVVEQMKHLVTYPFIKKRFREKSISIYGWYYIIETGEIYNYNAQKGYFELLN